MTDEQIIKAVDVCRNPDTCRGCPYHELYTAGCVAILMEDVFDLINRQKAEIERLKQELGESELSADITETILEEKNKDISDLIFKERSNAIMEFAEGLKESADNDGCGEDFVLVSDIDILLKEMTEVD